MKKKLLSAILASSFVLSAVPAMAEDTVTVTLNGNAVVFADQQPLIKDSRTLVPVRGVLEEMGVEVVWDGDTQTIDMSKGDTKAQLVIGSDTLTINDYEKVTLDVAPEIIGERTMLPIRAAAEAFGAEVSWDDATKTVVITTESEDNTSDAQQGENVIEKSEVSFEAVEGTNFYSSASYTSALKTSDGKALIEADVTYPYLNGKTTNDAAVNAYIEETVNTYVDSYFEESEEITAKEAADLGEDFRTHTIYIDFEDFFYNEEENLISYLERVSTYTGGAHPNTVGYGMTIDIETGSQVSISDLAGSTGEEAITDTQRAANFLKEEIAANPDAYFENAAEYIDEAMPGEIGCYLGQDKVIVFASAGSIAAYAQGMLKFEVEIN